MGSEREQLQRRLTIRTIAATALAIMVTVVATSGVAPSEPSDGAPSQLSFVLR